MKTSCCLSLPPPTSTASLIPTNPPQLPLVKNGGWWRRKCVVIMGVASLSSTIGVEMCNSVTLSPEALDGDEIVLMATSEDIANKWSEKIRKCPPWRGSSLETVVPENLPRPSARRRYQTVRSPSMTAPPLSAPVKLHTKKPNCFSM